MSHNNFYTQVQDRSLNTYKTTGSPKQFEQLLQGENPPLLWIGCGSGIAAHDEAFINKKATNTLIYNDINTLSVIDYSVNILLIKHIVVCGQYGNSIKDATPSHTGIVDNWMQHVKDVYRLNGSKPGAIADADDLFDDIAEVNVKAQIQQLANSTVVQNAWNSGMELYLHGWVYGVNSGVVKDLGINLQGNSDLLM